MILQMPVSLLNQKSKKVAFGDLSFVATMKKELQKARDPLGVGLAAVQIGILQRAFITHTSFSFRVYINPKVSFEGELLHAKEPEGCLSIKDIFGYVKRYPKVTISYLDENWVTKTEEKTGFEAIVIQHEYDHLEGILFTERVLSQTGKIILLDKRNCNCF